MIKKAMVCKRCDGSFTCTKDIATCMCSTVSLRQETIQFLMNTWPGCCLCNGCMVELDGMLASIAGENFPNPSHLVEGIDFYKEGGLIVFTARYHLLRGNCCRSGCRHCPYGFKLSH